MIERKVTHHSAASATATGTVMNCTGLVGALAQVTGTFSATVTFQATIDASNWVAIEGYNLNTGAKGSTATAAGLYYVSFAGARLFRCNLTWTSGTSVTVTSIGVSDGPSVSLADVDIIAGETVQGDVAHDAADSGNPLKIGGKAETTAPAAVADGDRVNAWFDEYGRLVTVLQDTSGNPQQWDDTDKAAVSLYGKGSAAGDVAVDVTAAGQVAVVIGSTTGSGDAHTRSTFAVDNSAGSAGILGVMNYLRNDGDAKYYYGRMNDELTVLASAARTATTNSSDQLNHNHRGIILFVDITARAAATTLTPNLQVKEPVGGNYITIWTAAAALNSADTTVAYLFYPSALADAAALYTEAVDLTFGFTWRVAMTHSDADSITYSVSCARIV